MSCKKGMKHMPCADRSGEDGRKRGLLVADLDNLPSTKVILANGGKLASIGRGAMERSLGGIGSR